MKKPFISQFFIFLLFRLSSVIVIQTSYVPDEYWQSLEVAHNITFGYGYLTWEWIQGLRSFLYPFFFSFFYKILKLLRLDFSFLIILVPKVVQSFLTAVSDQYFLLMCKNFKLDEYWVKVAIFTNWFWYYCGSRTLSNTFETSLTIIGLNYYPWELFINGKSHNKNLELNWVKIRKHSLIYLMIASVTFIVRPTAITIWGPFVLFELFFLRFKFEVKFLIQCVLPVVLSTLFLFVIDCWWYGKFVIPAYNFLVFNIFKEISSFYGTHPVYWYITSGLPVVLGFHFLTIIVGVFHFFSQLRKTACKFGKIYGMIIFIFFLNIIILSNIPHKEFRFLLPLSPMILLLAIKFSTEFFIPSRRKLKFLWTSILFIGFIVPNIFIGIFHQKGTLSLMGYLRSASVKCYPKCSFLFLMPCHSTPLYSHLHMNITTKFLTCEPPLEENNYDEAADFFSDPNNWLNRNWDEKNVPSHVAFFDDLENSISQFLLLKGFVKKKKFLHTIFAKENMGRHVLVYEPS